MTNAQTAKARGMWQHRPGSEFLDDSQVYQVPLTMARLNSNPHRLLSRRESILLGAIILVLHGTVIYWVSSLATPALTVVPPEIPPMTIEFSQPAPPVAESSPPPSEPIPQPVVEKAPVEDELAVKPPPPKPVVKPEPKPITKRSEQPAPPAAPTLAKSAPTPSAPEKITPASANAGYLHNPAPEYPALAMRRNWEGTVLLRVHVMSSGKPSDIQIQTSSGHQQLDESALAAVKRWSFVPAKQGNEPVDGWVNVPIDFKIQ